MKRFVTILTGVALVLLLGIYLRHVQTQPGPKKLDIIVTIAGVTNNATGDPLVAFRISNPYSRYVWYVPPKWGSTNPLYQGPWQQPFKLLGPHQSDVVPIPPPRPDAGTNRWRVTFRAGLKQNKLQRLTDPVADKLRRTSRNYGANVVSAWLDGLTSIPATPEGALFNGVVEGDAAAVAKAISDGAPIDFRRGWTMLHLNAMHGGSTNVARVLLQNGVSVFAGDRDGETARDIAKRNGYRELERLLEKAEHEPTSLSPF